MEQPSSLLPLSKRYGKPLPSSSSSSSRRAPFMFLHGLRLDPPLLAHLLSLPFFQQDLRRLHEGMEGGKDANEIHHELEAYGLELPDSSGFDKCIDHPTVPTHHYWEGCFHGLLTKDTVHNIHHPRFHRAYSMPPAPLPLRAFMHCLREKVRPTHPPTHSYLPALSNLPTHPPTHAPTHTHS